MSEVSELLEQLASGKVGIQAVVSDFAKRRWVAVKRPSTASYAKASARAGEDFDPIPEGSWSEVEAAYVSGVITEDQYRTLFEARTR